jgi:hypothetical protein
MAGSMGERWAVGGGVLERTQAGLIYRGFA